MQPFPTGEDPTAVVGKRFLAGLIDLVPVVALLWILSTVLQVGTTPGVISGSATSDQTVSAAGLVGYLVVTYLVPLAAAAVNGIWLRSRSGASLGQRALGLVTVDEQGQIPSVGALVGRFFLGIVDAFPWVCCYLPIVGMITIAASKGHRRVADMVVRSYVVPEAYRGVVLGPPANLTAPAGPWAQPVGPPQAGPADGPQWDPARGTWIRWDPTSGRWFGWHEPSGSWLPLD